MLYYYIREELTKARKPQSQTGAGYPYGGEGGIRTHGGSHLAGFQDQSLKPLDHLSVMYSKDYNKILKICQLPGWKRFHGATLIQMFSSLRSKFIIIFCLLLSAQLPELFLLQRGDPQAFVPLLPPQLCLLRRPD